MSKKSLDKATDRILAGMDDFLKALRRCRAEQEKPAPAFEVGQKVVVWETGEHGKVAIGNKKTPGILVNLVDRPFVLYHVDELLLTPPRPSDTPEYTVGEYTRPKRYKHGGWLTTDGCIRWFDETNNFCCDTPDHGYRYTITHPVKPKLPDTTPVVQGWRDEWLYLWIDAKTSTVFEIDTYSDKDVEFAVQAGLRLVRIPRSAIPLPPIEIPQAAGADGEAS